MRGLLMMLLSLILISSAVSAIVITEIDDETTNPITINTGENISIALIREELKEIKAQLVSEIEVTVLERIESFEQRADNYFSTIISKIGLGFLSLALFIFNLALAKKLLIEMVFENGWF